MTTSQRARKRAIASCSTCSRRAVARGTIPSRSRLAPTRDMSLGSRSLADADPYRPSKILGLMARSLLLPTAAPAGPGVAVEPDGGISVTYVGHATVLVRLGGTTLLTDPVWSSRLVLPKRLVAPRVALDA